MILLLSQILSKGAININNSKEILLGPNNFPCVFCVEYSSICNSLLRMDGRAVKRTNELLFPKLSEANLFALIMIYFCCGFCPRFLPNFAQSISAVTSVMFSNLQTSKFMAESKWKIGENARDTQKFCD